jgi:hypothetical protein
MNPIKLASSPSFLSAVEVACVPTQQGTVAWGGCTAVRWDEAVGVAYTPTVLR